MAEPIKLKKEIYKNDNGDTIFNIFFEWIISTKDIDNWDDIVNPFWIDYIDYMKSPIIKANHQYEIEYNIWRCTELIPDSNQIKAKWYFVLNQAIEDEKMIAHKLENWLLNCFSIWYTVTQSTFQEINWKQIRYIDKWKIFEFSIVDIPMNWKAVITKNLKDLNNLQNNIKNMEENNIKQEETKEIEVKQDEIKTDENIEIETKSEEVKQENTELKSVLAELLEIKTLLKEFQEAKKDFETKSIELSKEFEVKKLELETKSKTEMETLKKELEVKAIANSQNSKVFWNFTEETKSQEDLSKYIPKIFKK